MRFKFILVELIEVPTTKKSRKRKKSDDGAKMEEGIVTDGETGYSSGHH